MGEAVKSQPAKHLVTRAAWTGEGHKTQAENLNLSGFDLGSALNTGPASGSSWHSNLEPKQCRLVKHTHHEQGQTQCGQDTGSTPHRVHICLQCSSVPTARLNK